MATYNRYYKLQKYYLGVPVEPAIYKQGEFAMVYETEDIFACQYDLDWMLIDGEYLCESNTDGTYTRYEKLLGYHKDGTVTNPEVYTKGAVIAENCNSLSCGKDTIIVVLDKENQQKITKTTKNCGNTYEDVVEDWNVTEVEPTQVSGIQEHTITFLGEDGNIYYLEMFINARQIGFGTISTDGIYTKIKTLVDESEDLYEAIKSPGWSTLLPYYDGTKIFIGSPGYKLGSDSTGIYVQQACQMIVYDTTTDTFIISDFATAGKIYGYSSFTQWKPKVYTFKNMTVCVWLNTTEERIGDVSVFKYDDDGTIYSNDVHYDFDIDEHDLIYNIHAHTVNLKTKEIIIGVQKKNPLFVDTTDTPDMISTLCYIIRLNLPQTYDEAVNVKSITPCGNDSSTYGATEIDYMRNIRWLYCDDWYNEGFSLNNELPETVNYYTVNGEQTYYFSIEKKNGSYKNRLHEAQYNNLFMYHEETTSSAIYWLYKKLIY